MPMAASAEELPPPLSPSSSPAALHQPPSCTAAQQYDFGTGHLGDDDADLYFLRPPPSYPDEAQYDFGAGDVGDDGADLFMPPPLPYPPMSLMEPFLDDEHVVSLNLELAALEQREEALRNEIADLLSEVRRAENNYQEREHQMTSAPLVAGHVVELVGESHAVVTTTAGPRALCVPVLGTIDRELLKPSTNVALALHNGSLALVSVLPADAGWAVPVVEGAERPGVTYADIGGCEDQKRDVLEAVELPLTHPELFARVGVDPPRGVLLHGPPGTGKTMLAKAVAHHTSAAFIRVSGAQFVHRHPGEGPRMLREVFQVARDRAPAIVFIDEVDAIAAARSDSDDASGADREVHRILLELLAQMDGFDPCAADVRVIMASNRADALDPALLRPGRLDRKVEFPLPGGRQKRLVFQACTAGMSLHGDVDLEDLVARHDEMSAAEIDAVCREAGMRAVRDSRCVVTHEDFDEGYRAVAKNIDRGADEFSFYS